MDENAFDQTVERLKKANAVIDKLDPAIRSDAFALLRDYVVGGDAGDRGRGRGGGGDPKVGQEKRAPLAPDATEDALVERYESDKDFENALLCLAIVYKRHGRGPYPNWDPLKNVASHYSLEIPKALHMTFKTLKRDDQIVLRKQADGWKITPSGEKWLKTTYGVGRGKEPLPEK